MSSENYEKLFNCRGNKFFEILEEVLQTSISIFIKNILKLNGFDSAIRFTKYEDSCVTEIEDFMRNDFDIVMVPSSDIVENYLGRFKYCQKKFKLLSGHKILLNIVKETCQNILYQHQSMSQSGGRFVDRRTSEITDTSNSLYKKIGAQMITVYNDAKKITLSAWSWPSRQVASTMSAQFQANGHGNNDINFQYLTPGHQKDLLDSIVKSDFQNIKSRIDNSIAVSIRVDGSTDRTQDHNVYVMAKLVSVDGSTETIFLGFKTPKILKPPDLPSEAYYQAVKDSVSDILPWEDLFSKTSSVVTDGEYINTGDLNSLWAKLARERLLSNNCLMPLLSIWCAAHRINLAWKSICDQLSFISNVIMDASNLSSYFHRSGQRTQKLKNISLENAEQYQKFIRYPKHFEVRWTQFTHSLLTAVLRNWKASIEYFKNEKQLGLLNLWLNYDRIHLITFLADILNLYQAFQKTFEFDSITVFDIRSKKSELVTKFMEMKTAPRQEGWEELFLNNLVDSENETLFFGHMLIRNNRAINKFDTIQRNKILDLLTNSLNDRLDADLLIYQRLEPLFKVDPSTSDDSLKNCHSLIIPDLNKQSFYSEYRAAAELLAYAECMGPIDYLKTLHTISKDQFTILKTALARIMAAKPHSADVERLINIYNKFKDDDRCSLSSSTLFNYLYVHYNMGPLDRFDPSSAVQHWLNIKTRRPRPNSKAKEQEWFIGVFKDADKKMRNASHKPKIMF